MWKRSGRCREDVRWYYGTPAERFAELRPGRLAQELEASVRELDEVIGAD